MLIYLIQIVETKPKLPYCNEINDNTIIVICNPFGHVVLRTQLINKDVKRSNGFPVGIFLFERADPANLTWPNHQAPALLTFLLTANG